MVTPRRETGDPPSADRTGLLTYAEAAVQLRVHPRTIRNWADSGRLVRVELSHQIQRVTVSSVERLIRDSFASST